MRKRPFISSMSSKVIDFGTNQKHVHTSQAAPCVNGDTSFLWESETFWLFFSISALGVRPLHGHSRKMARTTCFHTRMCLLQ